MIVRATGVLLASMPYSETSLILRVYTEEFGLNSFLFKGARSKKNNRQHSVFRVFSLIEIVHYRGKSELHLVKEYKIDYPLHQIAASPEKGCICLFLSEFLLRIISPDVPDKSIYNHLHNSIKWLDLSENYKNFHLQFLLRLSGFLGVYPESVEEFVVPVNVESLDEKLLTNSGIRLLMNHPEYNDFNLGLSSPQRRALLRQLITYFNIHLDLSFEVKSLDVLEEVFR